MANVNTGEQNKPSGGGRSILDYSLVACFTLIVLLGILVLDAFEYITIPGGPRSARAVGGALATDSGVDAGTGAPETNEELAEVQKQIEEAKKTLAAKQAEVAKLVDKVEDEIKKEEPAKVETAEEKENEEQKKKDVVEAVVKKELSIDRFCGGCRYGGMNFTCAKRMQWMMTAYGLNEDQAKEALLSKCGYRRLRGDAFDGILN